MADEMFVNERIENVELAELMGKVRENGSEENMVALLKASATSKFIVPVDGEEGKYSFHAVSDSKDNHYMVVYSDTDSFEVAFEKKESKQKGVIAGFADLVDTVMADSMGLSGFVINPGAEEVLFGRDMLKLIWEQMQGGDDTAKVGEPDHYPSELKTKLQDYVRASNSCKAVWVRLLRENKTNVLRWMIVCDMNLSGDELSYELGNLKSYLMPYLDGLDALTVSAEEEFARKVITGVKPFVQAGEL